MNKRVRALEMAACAHNPGWKSLDVAMNTVGISEFDGACLLNRYAEISRELFPSKSIFTGAGKMSRRLALCELAARIRSGDA